MQTKMDRFKTDIEEGSKLSGEVTVAYFKSNQIYFLVRVLVKERFIFAEVLAEECWQEVDKRPYVPPAI